MHSNDANNTNTERSEPIYKDLSYMINGVLFATHNELGPYSREKQYGDVAARIFKEKGSKCLREV